MIILGRGTRLTSMRRPRTHIALLRGINVGGHNKLPMAVLRSLCLDIGWTGVQTYIQSGNLSFDADGSVRELENALESAIESDLGLPAGLNLPVK